MSIINQRPLNAPTPEILAQLTQVVGPDHAIPVTGDQQPYLREWRDRYVGCSPLILRPRTTDEVARILAIANDAHIGIVPQAGNTGLVGGQIPSRQGDEIVLSVDRMRDIRPVDTAGQSLIAQAGASLADVQAAAESAGRLFALSMASEGSARVGGVLATNAGGLAVVKYGTARSLTLGLEVVLADGRVWDGLRTLKKDNTGYDLRDLFIGSEGTLGVITAAALRLHPAIAERATAFIALPSLAAVLDLFKAAERSAADGLTAFEFMSAEAAGFAARHIPGVVLPLAGAHPWFVLMELSSAAADGRPSAGLERLLASATEGGMIADGVIAGSLAQSRALWRIRESLSEAQKPEGGSIKHDVSVPPHLIADFIAKAAVIVERLCPGARPVPFGHFGDGNVHYNVSQPVGMPRPAFLDQWDDVSAAVHGLVHELGGSISAEHGIGQMKRGELLKVKSAVELDVMRAIKAALDPNGILNPGKLLGGKLTTPRA